MKPWLTYIKERFQPIPQGILISGMALIAYQTGSWGAFASVFLGLLLFFFLLRAMDEYKDFDKDCIAHPDRPLPKGLISKNEMHALIHLLIFGMGAYSVFLCWTLTFSAGFAFLIVTGYLYAMFHEFNLKSYLSKRPLLYALSHQLIVVPLSAFLIAARGLDIFSFETLYTSFALFGGFFAYEICRKLDPKAHPILKTYPRIYGRVRTAIFAILALCILGFCGYCLHLSPFLWPVALILAAALFYYCFSPSLFKAAEKLSAVNLLVCIYSLGIKAAVFS